VAIGSYNHHRHTEPLMLEDIRIKAEPCARVFSSI
jgi:hypothetical protein